MKASEAVKYLGIGYQYLQGLRRGGEIKATPILNKSWTKNSTLWDYDEESVRNFKIKLEERSNLEGELLLQCITSLNWKSEMVITLNKLYGFSKRLNIWMPFHKITDVSLVKETGRIMIKGYSITHEKIFHQVYRKYFPKLREKGWLKEWDYIFDQVNVIIEKYLSRPNRKVKKWENKVKKWMEHKNFLFPSEIQ